MPLSDAPSASPCSEPQLAPVTLQVRWYPDPLLRVILYFDFVLMVFSGLILFRGLAVKDSAWTIVSWQGFLATILAMDGSAPE